MQSHRPTRLAAALLTLTLSPVATLAENPNPAEIDVQIWDVISSTVAAHDIAGMATIYHPEAVLVHAQGTDPIGPQLARWGKDMETMRAAGIAAQVAFRFSARQDSETAAFETGIFRYATTDSSGAENASYVHLEALLLKRDDRWLIVMERQLGTTDEKAWNALRQSP